jgi:hypothetical protein
MLAIGGKSNEQQGLLNEIESQTLTAFLSSPPQELLPRSQLKAASDTETIFWRLFGLLNCSFQVEGIQIHPLPVQYQIPMQCYHCFMSCSYHWYIPAGVEERNLWPWWMVKKLAIQIMSHLIFSSGILSYIK